MRFVRPPSIPAGSSRARSLRTCRRSGEKFELVINVQTASTLGLNVPADCSRLADEVIESAPPLICRICMSSAIGTFLPCQPRRAMSVIGGCLADICSMRVLRILTPTGHRAPSPPDGERSGLSRAPSGKSTSLWCGSPGRAARTPSSPDGERSRLSRAPSGGAAPLPRDPQGREGGTPALQAAQRSRLSRTAARARALLAAQDVLPGGLRHLARGLRHHAGAPECACAICNRIPDKRLAVDHCHTSGKVRGLLCAKCNSGLAFYEDNPRYLLAAVSYCRHRAAMRNEP